MTTNFSPGENTHDATESQKWNGAHPLHPHPSRGVTAETTKSDRFPRLKPQTIGVFAMVKNDIANEQPEQKVSVAKQRKTRHENNKTPAEAEVLVGLTRIELVTSSLSGMRSNRLSYSPGRTETLSAPTPEPQPWSVGATPTEGFDRIKGPFGDLFFEHRHPDAANHVTDEVKDGGE